MSWKDNGKGGSKALSQGGTKKEVQTKQAVFSERQRSKIKKEKLKEEKCAKLTEKEKNNGGGRRRRKVCSSAQRPKP